MKRCYEQEGVMGTLRFSKKFWHLKLTFLWRPRRRGNSPYTNVARVTGYESFCILTLLSEISFCFGNLFCDSIYLPDDSKWSIFKPQSHHTTRTTFLFLEFNYTCLTNQNLRICCNMLGWGVIDAYVGGVTDMPMTSQKYLQCIKEIGLDYLKRVLIFSKTRH